MSIPYFLDVNSAMAYVNAKLTEEISADSVCYCHADMPLPCQLTRLIALPISKLSSFFESNLLPLPTSLRVDGVHFHDQSKQNAIVSYFNNEIASIRQVRDQKNKLYAWHPLSRDALFMDPQVALFTALQNFAHKVDAKMIYQHCYALSDVGISHTQLHVVRREDYFNFFSTGYYKTPRVLVPGPFTPEAELTELTREIEQINQFIYSVKAGFL